MKHYKTYFYILISLLFLLEMGCQKHPTGSKDEPLEFPEFPETPE